MVALQIEEALAHKLSALASRQGRSMQDTLADALDYYEQATFPNEATESDGLEALIGMAEADVDDLSIRVREYMSSYFQREHGRSDLHKSFAGGDCSQ